MTMDQSAREAGYRFIRDHGQRLFTHNYTYHVFVLTVTTFKFVEGGPDHEAPEVV